MKLINSVFKTIISFAKSFSKLTHIGQIAVIIGLLYTAFLFGNCNGKSELDEFIVEYTEFKKNADNTVKYADSLKTQVKNLERSVEIKETTVKELKIQIAFNSQARERLKNEQKEIRQELKEAVTIRDTVIAQQKIITNLETQVATADTTILKQNQIISTRDSQLEQSRLALNLAMTRGDSLQKILLEMPDTPKNPDKLIFGIPKPSRKVVGVTALVVGVVLGAHLTK